MLSRGGLNMLLLLASPILLARLHASGCMGPALSPFSREGQRMPCMAKPHTKPGTDMGIPMP